MEKVIARKDYKRLTKTLKGRVEEIAYAVCEKLEELDRTCIMGYEVKLYRSNLGGESRLVVYNEQEGCYHSLQDINHEYGLHGDLRCLVVGATNVEALEFLNKATAIFKELEDIENEQVNAIQKALKETENL